MIRRVVDLQQPVATVAAAFGVSVRTVFQWLARFRAEGRGGLADRSSRAQCSPKTIHPLRVARGLALRRRRLPGFQNARAAKVSKASVSRLRRRHRHRLAALEPPPPVRRYERARPGEPIHFDIKQLARIVRTGHRVTGDRPHDHTPGAGWEFLHIAIEDHSRLAFALLFPDQTAQSAIAFRHAALAFFARHGIKAQRIYSDNGPCYRSRALRSASAALGLQQRFTRPYRPQTNGKAERFMQTSLREGAYAHAYSHSDQRSLRLPLFLHNDNWHRPHHSLNLLAPSSRLRRPLNNLLSLHN